MYENFPHIIVLINAYRSVEKESNSNVNKNENTAEDPTNYQSKQGVDQQPPLRGSNNNNDGGTFTGQEQKGEILGDEDFSEGTLAAINSW